MYFSTLIIKTVDSLFVIYFYLIFVRIIMSWIPGMRYSAFGDIIYKLTEPYLGFFRNFIPPLSLGGGGIDFSPIIAILAFNFIRSGTISILVFIMKMIGMV